MSDQVRRPGGLRVDQRCPYRMASAGPDQAELAHQALDRAPGDFDP